MRKIEFLDKKVLIISHNDLDGAGCIIVAKRFFIYVDWFKSNLYDLDMIINNFLSNNTFDEYDLIFFTDLCPNDEDIKKLCSSGYWSKIYIVDHHVSASIRLSHFDFITLDVDKSHIIIETNDKKDKELTSGTYLFLRFLAKTFSVKLTSSDSYFKKLVKTIRYWDTFLWTKKNYTTAVELNFVFKETRFDMFIEEKFSIIKYCLENEAEPFDFFTESEKQIIFKCWNEVQEAIDNSIITENYISCNSPEVFRDNFVNDPEVKFFKENKNISGVNTLIVATLEPKYVSLMSYFLFKEYSKASIIIFINLNDLSYSYRAREDSNIKVNTLATLFCGGGHYLASGSPYFDSNYKDFKIIQLDNTSDSIEFLMN